MAAAITFHETTQPVWPSQRVSVLMKYTVMILEDESFEGYYHHFKHEANGLLDGVVNLCRSRKPEMASLAMACENTRVRLGSLLEPLRPNVYKDFQVDYDNALVEDATTEGWSPLSLFSKNSRKELGGKIKNVRIIHSKGSLDDESDWEDNFEHYYPLDPVYLILWRAMVLRSIKVHSNPRIYGYSKTSRDWMPISFQQSIHDVGAGPFFICCDRQLPITFGDQIYGNMFKRQNGQSQYSLKRPSGQLVRVYAPSAGGMIAEWNEDSHSGRLPDYVDAFNSILLEVDKRWSIQHPDVSKMIPDDNRIQASPKPSTRTPEPDAMSHGQVLPPAPHLQISMAHVDRGSFAPSWLDSQFSLVDIDSFSLYAPSSFHLVEGEEFLHNDNFSFIYPETFSPIDGWTLHPHNPQRFHSAEDVTTSGSITIEYRQERVLVIGNNVTAITININPTIHGDHLSGPISNAIVGGRNNENRTSTFGESRE